MEEVEWSDTFNKKDEFKNEKEYQEFIERNIERFCEDVLGLGKYVEHKSNYALGKQGFEGTKLRVDLYVVGENESAIIELKYPKNYFTEIRNAISQLLFYSVIADSNNVIYNKLCLVSPVFDDRIFPIIDKFNLPIEMYYLTRSNHAKIELICQ